MLLWFGSMDRITHTQKIGHSLLHLYLSMSSVNPLIVEEVQKQKPPIAICFRFQDKSKELFTASHLQDGQYPSHVRLNNPKFQWVSILQTTFIEGPAAIVSNCSDNCEDKWNRSITLFIATIAVLF
jgi:hypothetical protein